MITEKILLPRQCDREFEQGKSPLFLSVTPPESRDRASVSDLDSLVSHLRIDASDDPIHYLLRSNTSSDGE